MRKEPSSGSEPRFADPTKPVKKLVVAGFRSKKNFKHYTSLPSHYRAQGKESKVLFLRLHTKMTASYNGSKESNIIKNIYC